MKIQFIDFGSVGWNDKICFPGTYPYLPGNKLIVESLEDIDMQNMMVTYFSDMDITKLTATSTKITKPGYGQGQGDNLWAVAITILESIYGQNPILKNGLGRQDLNKRILEDDLYGEFLESDVYKKFYQDDEEFEVVKVFLELGLVKCQEERWHNFIKFRREYVNNDKIKYDKAEILAAMNSYIQIEEE